MINKEKNTEISEEKEENYMEIGSAIKKNNSNKIK